MIRRNPRPAPIPYGAMGGNVVSIDPSGRALVRNWESLPLIEVAIRARSLGMLVGRMPEDVWCEYLRMRSLLFQMGMRR